MLIHTPKHLALAVINKRRDSTVSTTLPSKFPSKIYEPIFEGMITAKNMLLK